jgi:hypothetical protein
MAPSGRYFVNDLNPTKLDVSTLNAIITALEKEILSYRANSEGSFALWKFKEKLLQTA